MKQMRQGLFPPQELPRARCACIGLTRAKELAEDAMNFAHELLALVSTKSKTDVKRIFETWWESKGMELLKMSKSEARYGVGKAPEDEFLEEPPHPTHLLWIT
jgi:hypothetical protein